MGSEWVELLGLSIAVIGALVAVRYMHGQRFDLSAVPETTETEQQEELPGGFQSPPWLA